MRVAILTVATHKYIKFALPLWHSIKKYFLPGHDVNMFIHTDSQVVPDGCVRIYQQHKPFPFPTLMRFHMFDKNRKLYEEYDYAYYCDIDMLFVDVVGEEILSDSMAIKHPGYFNKSRDKYTYERRKESLACVSRNEGEYYYCGGFNGGKNYLAMASELSKRIQNDLDRGIVAVWHDESHLNRYLIDHRPDVILDPSYCYPEPPTDKQFGLDKYNFKPKLLALNKNHAKIRS